MARVAIAGRQPVVACYNSPVPKGQEKELAFWRERALSMDFLLPLDDTCFFQEGKSVVTRDVLHACASWLRAGGVVLCVPGRHEPRMLVWPAANCALVQCCLGERHSGHQRSMIVLSD